jgi:DtxR family Mn-dependent transcriptional regulator
MAAMMQSDTVEDYLKAIYELQEKYGRAKTSNLSARLRITPGSVTDMLKRLAGQRPRLVSYQSHKGVILTDLGCQKALAVIRRHRLLETFLHQVLGFSWDEVHAEAERLEHCLSDRLTEAIAAHLNHPACDPHGDPIPAPGGKMHQGVGCPLSELQAGQSARIMRVRIQDDAALRYLAKQGLEIGVTIHVLECSPLDGQLDLQILDRRVRRTFSLGRQVAAHIDVERIERFDSEAL